MFPLNFQALYWIQPFEFGKFDSKIVISDLENLCISIPKLSSNYQPPYWFHHFEFGKADIKIFVINLKNIRIPILRKT